ncbi:MAG: Eco57I restriction-modification methylase domain-containing protein [Candidatus Omnitrophica bacterium]|nr:Eco57I restriction-modification methylase domain-containing protein [Candidatus Omnitrophota bacterium]
MPKAFVEEYIPTISAIDDVYSFFKQLGFDTLTTDYKASLSSLGLRAKEKECVEHIYVVSNYDKRFQIYFIKLKTLSNEIIRSLPDLFLKTTHFPFLIFSSDFNNFSFVLVEKIRKDVGEFKRKIIKLNINKHNLYHTDAEVLSNIKLDGEKRPEDIYKKLTEAFSVEKVTDKFFKDYIRVFNAVKNHFSRQTKDAKSVHEFTQQLLNRIMFIYFVAKKRWLGDDLKFMTTFWDIYCKGKKKGDYKPDTFHDEWLSVLFFEAFNNKFSPRKYFPGELNKTLMLAPYLNGGLFTRDRLDDTGFVVKDSAFETIFTFLNRYNFTIREELPLEEEVAVDPEMIGRVYESLVDLAEKEGQNIEGTEHGIVYTARVEIDFMSRRSLVEYFYNQLHSEDVSKETIYRLVFAKTDDEKKEVEKELTKLKLWNKIEDALDNLSILDPACGSGSFLVGMLNILAGLYKPTYKNLNRPIDDFEIKKQIIGRSLYGVDVMEWACHVAELRLWLQLIVESELSIGDLKIKPLLPTLTFKIRSGDSLIQEMGGINLSLSNNKDLKPALKRKITELKQEKLKFFNNDPSRKYKSEELLLHAELNIFREILSDRILTLTNIIKTKQKGPDKKGQGELFSLDQISREYQKELEIAEEVDKKVQKEIEELTQEREHLREIKVSLDKGTKPFVWDIDFVEIFADEFEGGFDIVIGNPPYVRQEKIADPNISKEKVTNENKRQYKEKLLRSVQNHFPFIKSLDKKSDLYVYFYLQGLALLNRTGTFCFITSNSWLDVGYGKDLQGFLLNNVKMHAIYDNSVKRSFARADINTIIAVFSNPDPKGKKENLENIAKFVMFKKPFDDVLTVDNLLKIEKAKEITKTDDFRVYPKKQIELLEESWEYPEDSTEEQKRIYKFNIGKYESNKWGGKYLRAPDIFFTILEKGKDKLVKLSEIADVRRGFTTGANEFFYLDEEEVKKWRIEKEFLRPVIFSLKELTYIDDNLKGLNYKILTCHESKNKIKGTDVLRYIEWGEQQKFNKRPTCKNRQLWYSIGKEWSPAAIIFPAKVGERMLVLLNTKQVFEDKKLYGITPHNSLEPWLVCALLNSTLTRFFMDLSCRQLTGAQAIADVDVNVVENLHVLNSKDLMKRSNELKQKFNKIKRRKISTRLSDEYGLPFIKNIRENEPNPLPDRKELDDIIFDILGLTKQERKEVYWAVCELVKNRLEKAKSV